jgi:RsiW-degrading membrane proteinase PrsW (M82 family)
MQIIVHRQGQDYGPYPVEVVLQHLSQGKLLSNDLARETGTLGASGRALQPLHKLLSISGFLPVRGKGAIAAWRQARQDLHSFDPALLLPVRTMFSREPFREPRLLYLAAVGLLPAALLSLSPGIGTAYWMIALYFSGLWSVFFYQCFKTPQVQRWTCLVCFFFTGCVSIPPLLLIQEIAPWIHLYAMAGSGNLIDRAVGMFLAVGPNEEICKAAILFWLVSRPGIFLIPQTMVFYGMMSGLGFGIYEGVHYQQGVNRSQGVDMAYLLNVARLTSLPFLHAIWTGLAGYFIAFAALYPNRRYGLWIVAIALPAVLHASYDTFGWSLLGIGSAFLSVVLLMIYLSKTIQWQRRLAIT